MSFFSNERLNLCICQKILIFNFQIESLFVGVPEQSNIDAGYLISAFLKPIFLVHKTNKKSNCTHTDTYLGVSIFCDLAGFTHQKDTLHTQQWFVIQDALQNWLIFQRNAAIRNALFGSTPEVQSQHSQNIDWLNTFEYIHTCRQKEVGRRTFSH